MGSRKSRGPLADLARGWRRMTPSRILLRYMTGGHYETIGGLVRGAVRSAAPSPRAIPMRPVPPGSALPVTKEAAERSRAVVKQPAKKAVAKKAGSAKKAAAKRTAAGRVQVPKRNPDGTFDGSVSYPGFGPREQAMYERHLRGQVDPAQQVRQMRWPR